MTEELVVLVDADGVAIGTAAKSTVHGSDTPLHRAFSCHVRNAAGDVLVTRRALTKPTWPGVWTNSFCGHPAPGEDDLQAVRRRARDELNLEISDVTALLPDFRYRAVDASGIVENEVCPVYSSQATADPMPNPDEVCEWRWVDPHRLSIAVANTPWAFSPWLVSQIDAIDFYASSAR